MGPARQQRTEVLPLDVVIAMPMTSSSARRDGDARHEHNMV
jgi:hypothetical protein